MQSHLNPRFRGQHDQQAMKTTHDEPMSKTVTKFRSLDRFLGNVPMSVVASCTAYMFCSMGMILLNKSVMSKFSFTFNATVLFLQGLMTVVVLGICKFFNVVKFQPLSAKIAKQWIPVNILFICMLFTSFKT
jgi:hypothetical protein